MRQPRASVQATPQLSLSPKKKSNMQRTPQSFRQQRPQIHHTPLQPATMTTATAAPSLPPTPQTQQTQQMPQTQQQQQVPTTRASVVPMQTAVAARLRCFGRGPRLPAPGPSLGLGSLRRNWIPCCSRKTSHILSRSSRSPHLWFERRVWHKWSWRWLLLSPKFSTSSWTPTASPCGRSCSGMCLIFQPTSSSSPRAILCTSREHGTGGIPRGPILTSTRT
mmetsp:Transcript_35519/g.76692  ORF Transcript_35519/g.76692 Transcript_35519/m.76692 type:complete len:221 (+) Transcript_35519:270-932(+)